MPLVQTRGAASAQGFGEFAQAGAVNYIEDYFSTYLVTGDGTAPSVNNGIDLSTKGGLVWIKRRSAAGSHNLFDTARGANLRLISNDTAAQDSKNLSFTTTGFSNYIFDNGVTEVSWSWAKAPKYFDVVTYTGNGSGNRIITSSLGSPIGCVFIKRTDSTSNWATAHRKDGSAVATGFNLNTTAAALYPNSTNATFDATGGFNAGYIVDSTGDGVNFNGATYVAYLFAHDAGGFGLSGTDNVISCGSYTGNGSSTGPTVTLGYEPQWIMVKRTDSTGSWLMLDIMRGIPNTPGVAAGSAYLFANSSNAEDSAFAPFAALSATGFSLLSSNAQFNASGGTYIYIAIRRGPMKVPTLGTSVFAPVAYAGNSVINRQITTGFTTDVIWRTERFKTSGVPPAYNGNISDRLSNGMLRTNLSDANDPTQAPVVWASNTGVIYPTDNYINNATGSSYILYGLQRAPSFFDEVCYTGVGGTASFSHNLGVAPELIFVKSRSAANGGLVYNKTITASKYLELFFTSEGHYAASNDTGGFAGVEPTSSVFTVGFYNNVNTNGATYTAYLFATCAGVSKVGSYTGTGALQTINCGFAAGARFVLIKRTDSTGDWWSYDSARGITSGNDPYLYWNNTDAEVTTTNYVDTDSTGFKVTAAAPAGLNANGGTYIFLAIA